METKALRSGMVQFQAWSSAELQTPVQSREDVVVDIRVDVAHLPPAPATVPTHLSTLGAALKSGTGKFVGQTISSGVGELAGAGVRIGLELADSIPSASMPMLVAKGALVLVGGGLAGYKAGQTVQEGYGVSNTVRAAVTLAPVLVPAGLALGTGLTGGSLAAASVVLGESIARMASSGVRDFLNEMGRGAIGDTRAVDAEGRPLTHQEAVDRRGAVGMLAPLLPNIGVAAMGQTALTGKVDGATSATVVKGGYAFMLEGGRAVAALADGGGLEYVPGEGLHAVSRNLRDFKGTLKRACEQTSMRIGLGALSGDIPGATGSEPYSTSILQGFGEVRSAIVERAQARREQPAHGETLGQASRAGRIAGDSPAAHQTESLAARAPHVGTLELQALPGHVEREDSEGSVHSQAELPDTIPRHRETHVAASEHATAAPESPEPIQEDEPPA